MAVLVAGTSLLYWPVRGFDFVNFDDVLYIVQNPHVKYGFNRESFLWCFQAGYASYWQPLTWLSHLLDCQLFGLRPGPPHLENVALHAVSSVLLFLALRQLTGATWRSAAVAALFAWHPLRVESVAWIAERKDVLCAVFWMGALWTYARFAQAASGSAAAKRFYVLTLAAYALGLTAKPMVITLPCVLWLLDWWPLRRLGVVPVKKIILEKVPFMVLAAASSWVTITAARRAGSATRRRRRNVCVFAVAPAGGQRADLLHALY
ncbi:MAG: hypothetical protein ACLQVY_04860 [Limisphaerales bacterium]